jgi:Xaa-Pro aminopeptidase
MAARRGDAAGLTMAHLDRHRAQALMRAAGLDALLFLSPEGFRYATGAEPGPAAMWRRAGAAAALVPADPAIPELAVTSDLFAAAFRRASHVTDLRETPIWVETADVTHRDLADPGLLATLFADRPATFARPETFDPDLCWRHLLDGLADRGLDRGRIGLESAALSPADLASLATRLPQARLLDATEVIGRLRMVKSPAEIAHLRRAVELAEAGILALRVGARPGLTRDELAGLWRDGVAAARGDAALTGAWEYVSVGPMPWAGAATARPGDILKVDVGCVVAGYTSDTGRTFSLGPPPDAARRLFAALAAGFDAGLERLRPGVPLAEVHRTTTAAIRAAGLPGFSRGHFGHGLGASLGSEEWPFVSATAPVVIEPGMVLAFETPLYVDGLGGFIIEDQILIGETGPEPMNRLPRDLAEL